MKFYHTNNYSTCHFSFDQDGLYTIIDNCIGFHENPIPIANRVVNKSCKYSPFYYVQARTFTQIVVKLLSIRLF